MIRLSIVIPAIGSQPDIDDTLVSILENKPSDCEVLVVHKPSYVDPYELGDEVQLIEVTELPKSVGSHPAIPYAEALALFNAGFQKCRGSVVHTVLPGVTVGPGWCDTALELFATDRNVGSVSPCVVARGNRRTIQGVAYHSGRGKKIVRDAQRDIIAPMIGTGFFQASPLRFMHGFQARFGPYADIELGLRLRLANYKAERCDSRIYVDQTQKVKPVVGYRGGRLRGDLHLLASRAGLASFRQGLIGLCAEPFIGFRAVGATFGRIVAYLSRPTATVLPMTSDVSTGHSRDDNKAA